MALSAKDVEAINHRAQQVGEAIGWGLRFVVAPNPEYVGLAVAPDSGSSWPIIDGPFRLSDLAAHEVEFTLDALESGQRRIVLDDDGDPRLT